ncbi:hypothetical protein [Dactylosporangium sp. NPDC005555]|uniref:hypothetical protein n=1 Tax=Dactylosporangium sp. NPDC005555 TaxID=3154889 RepID=UPI0033A2048C
MMKKLAVGTAVAALAVGLAAAPANAVVVSTDPVKITEQELDFGGSPWILGAPVNSGVLGWDNTGGRKSAILSGTLYINNASGTCARMRLETYDAAHNLVNYRDGGTVCAPNGALNPFSVYFQTAADPSISHAHAILQVQNTGGTYTDVGVVIHNY